MKQTWICTDCGAFLYDLTCEVLCEHCPTRCPHVLKDDNGRQHVPHFFLKQEEPKEYYEEDIPFDERAEY